ncbi:MAG: hypothetical protein CME65_11565 [Halobacteriovoraceae bacterium]|nr:hypothetical protein [Halobacteriovoraceae bacterium]|tara:strand:+ start:26968 stop:27816 length:849 start_codon:yes stop_codon:yes gene_type:complete
MSRCLSFTSPARSTTSEGIYILGVPLDHGSKGGDKGEMFAPAALRLYSRINETYSMHYREILDDIESIYDLGNLNFSSAGSLEDVGESIDFSLRSTFTNYNWQSQKIVFLGGNQLVTKFTARFIASSVPDLEVIHLSAHSFEGESVESQDANDSALRELSMGISVWQVGLRSFSRAGHKRIIKSKRLMSVSELRDYLVQNKSLPIYLSLNIDVFDPSIAPAVSDPIPDGFKFTELKKILEFFKLSNVVAADIVGLNPNKDRNSLSVATTSGALRELIFNLLD